MSSTNISQAGASAVAAAILLGTFASNSSGQEVAVAYVANPSSETNKNRRKLYIAGFGITHYEVNGGVANWSHAYAVKALESGRGKGTVRVELVEYAADGSIQFDIEYTSVVDCVEFDRGTGEAWIGGTIVDTNVPELLNVYVVDYALDSGPGGTDLHGDFLVEEGSGVTCHDRPPPYFPDPVTLGDIYYFKDPWNGPKDE